MSTQNVIINGTAYPSVPAIEIPKSGTAGNAVFVEISDTEATRGDVREGVKFYTADGSLTTGTLSGIAVYVDTSDAAGHWTRTITADAFGVTDLSVTANGTYTPPTGQLYDNVVVNVSGGGGGNIQTNKNATPSTAQVVVTPDTGYDGMAKVTIAAITSGTASTPTKTITANPTISVSGGTISANVSGSSSITPSVSAGWVNSGTAGTVSVSGTSSVAATALDTNLVAGNIKNGTTILGVTGTYTGGGSVNVGTKTFSNTSATATQISFSSLSGTPKAFFVRCTTTLTRSSSYRYYYVADMRWDGSSSGGVAGNRWYMYNGQYYNITSGYSYTYSNGTLTLSSTGAQNTSPGAFYNGTYELVYVY